MLSLAKHPQAVTIYRSYDNLIAEADGNGATHSMHYDAIGNRTCVTSSGGGASVDHISVYDAAALWHNKSPFSKIYKHHPNIKLELHAHP